VANWGPGANQLDTSQTGDGKKTGFNKLKASVADIYSKLNVLRTFRSASAEPTDVVEKEFWYNESDNGLYRRGANSSDLAEFKIKDIITKGPVVDVRAFGAKGDGVTDDTTSIQAAINEGGTILLPMGTYVVGPLWARDNSNIVFDGGAMLYANTSYAEEGALDNRVLNIVCVDNVTVVNPVIKMRKADYSGTGRHQHCINIMSATKVRILGGYLYDGGGDGIYVGRNVYGDAEYPATDDPAEDVYLRDVIVDNCYRNGLSIVSVKRMWVDNCQFFESIGQDPQAGVDIEPNSGIDYIEHLYLSNVRTYNNGGNGIGVNLYGFRDTSLVANVTIDNHVDVGSYYGCHTAETYGNPNSRVVINNSRYIDNVRAGLFIESKTLTGFSLVVNNPYIQNCNTSGSTDISAGAACAIASSSLDTNGIAMGNITIRGLEVVDTRGTALIQTGVYLKDNQAGLFASDISIDIRKLQGILTRKFAINGNAKVTVIDDSDVLISYPTSSGSETILSYNRKISNKNATGTVYRTLPDLTADSDGVDYTFICEAAYSLQVKVQSGQRILPLNQVAGKYVQSNKPGSRIKLRFKYPDWHVVEITGDWTIEGATAAPAAGTWIVGQKVYSSAPAAGGYMGWVCVTAGTPGTWKGFGAIEA